MRRRFSLLLVLFLICIAGQAQKNELGLFLGISQYQGELAKNSFTPEATHGATGIYFRRFIAGNLAYRTQFDITVLDGRDRYASNNKEKGGQRKSRNLSFSTWITSVNAHLELHLFKPTRKNEFKFNPYVFAGIGIFHYDPKTKLQGKEYKLRDLPTELNKPKYQLTDVNIPFGFGLRKKSKNGWIIGCTFQFHYTFTDYIDDVSGRWADYDAVLETYGADVALLGDRSRELKSNNPQQPNPDSNADYKKLGLITQNGKINRGLAETVDTYYYIGFTIGRSIGRSGGTSDGLRKGLFRTRKGCYTF